MCPSLAQRIKYEFLLRVHRAHTLHHPHYTNTNTNTVYTHLIGCVSLSDLHIICRGFDVFNFQMCFFSFPGNSVVFSSSVFPICAHNFLFSFSFSGSAEWLTTGLIFYWKGNSPVKRKFFEAVWLDFVCHLLLIKNGSQATLWYRQSFLPPQYFNFSHHHLP